MADACTFTRAVDAHFDGELPLAEAHALFLHLPTCDACRARYDGLAALEAIDPAAPGPQARLRRSLPLRAEPLRLSRIGVVSGALAMAAALLLMVNRPIQGDGFHARGAPEAPVAGRIEAYRMSQGSPPPRVEADVGRHEPLAFAYANPAAKKRLLVFATDEHRRVYWYYPAWTRADETPEAVPIVPTTSLVELGDAVTQDFDGRRVALHAVFADRPLTVRDVEARLSELPPLAPSLGIPETTEVTRMLGVR